MKKRWMAVALTAILLMAVGGAIGTVSVRQESANVYDLYFVERDLRAASGGDALRAEERVLSGGADSTAQQAEALMAELLKGPVDQTLKSPFPKGTGLNSVEQKGTEIHVDFSAVYGTLSGMDLTLADYAVTMTLAQLPDVARVRITVAGNNLDYRSRQVFLIRDILFPNEDGALTPEDRTLSLYEGDTQVSAVVRALENGPETKELLPVLPDGFKVRKTWLEEGTCYVSLSSALLDGQPDPASLTQAVASLEQSLLSLETVENVCFLVDGELSETFGPVELPD